MDSLLYGKDAEEGIVGLHLEKMDEVRIYKRSEQGVTSRTEKLFPIFWCTDESLERLGEGFAPIRSVELEGNHPYSTLVIASDWVEMKEMLKWLDYDGIYQITSPESMYLMQTGKTLFKGMTPDEVLHMEIDIETYTEGTFPNAEREADEVVIIAMRDGQGFEKVLHTSQYAKAHSEYKDYPFLEYCESEAHMIERMIVYIHRRDPDVIVGHNIMGFDLPYLKTRSRLHEINFALGRDNKEPQTWSTTRAFAERDFECTYFQIAGRSVIDTMFLAVDYDVYKRDLPGYGLKVIAQHFGIAAENRTYVEGSDIPRVWKNDPIRLLKYALDDVIETANLYDQLSASTFVLTQMIPHTYMGVHMAGTSTRIEMLMVREYLHRRHSLPQPKMQGSVRGGYTDLFKRGVFGKIDGKARFNYADVESLYPSIMMTYDVAPRSDTLKTFARLLSLLTDLRFDRKQKMKCARAEGRDHLADVLDSEQVAYKILINSFYGMLGFRLATFNDMEEADRVTATGQALLKRMIEIIDDMGGDIILCDTDGVLYELPEHIQTDDEVDAYVQRISDRMPEGIRVGNDGRFDAVLAYRPKNYVLVEAGSDKAKFKGVSFKGRSMEPILISYIRDVVYAMLRRDVTKVYHTHREVKRRIVDRDWDVEDFKRRGQIKQNLDEYTRELRSNENKNPQVQYELVLQREREDDDYEALPGDVVYYYVAGNTKAYKLKAYEEAKFIDEWTFGDENTDFYLKKRLKDTSKKFEPFFRKEDFQKVFSLNTDDLEPSLFGEDFYDVSDIEIQETQVNRLPHAK